MNQKNAETKIRDAAQAGEIVSTRLFAAPRETVFRAISDSARLARWWGPRGFTTTIRIFEFRPGGRWEFVMHAPNGAEYHNEVVFTEIVAPGRIVLDHLEPVHRFLMTMTLAPEAGGTRLTWVMRFADVDEGAKVRSFILDANEQNFDRLAAVLASNP